MKNTINSSLWALACIVISCNAPAEQKTAERQQAASTMAVDTIPRVTGIGGIFFKAKDRNAVQQWYAENLGMKVDDFGAPFEFRNANNPEEANFLNWDAFPDTTSYFAPSEKQFMINYRVQNIEGMVRKLQVNGATILGDIVSYPYGKFVHVLDPEGNKLELWEPVDSVLAEMGREANK